MFTFSSQCSNLSVYTLYLHSHRAVSVSNCRISSAYWYLKLFDLFPSRIEKRLKRLEKAHKVTERWKAGETLYKEAGQIYYRHTHSRLSNQMKSSAQEVWTLNLLKSRYAGAIIQVVTVILLCLCLYLCLCLCLCLSLCLSPSPSPSPFPFPSPSPSPSPCPSSSSSSSSSCYLLLCLCFFFKS